MTDDLEDAVLPRVSTSAEIVDALRRFGLALLPEYLDPKETKQLNLEFDAFFDNASAPWARSLIEREEGMTLPVVRNKLDMEIFPATSKLFSDGALRDVAEAYLDTSDIGFNHQVYVNKNPGTDRPVDGLPFLPHFDKINTLKFFVYLSDTTRENGAMGAALGSHIENRKIRETAERECGHANDVDNVFPGAPMSDVEAPAGSMFVFDTDVTHAAGFVQRGKERRIMRGHTRTMDVLRAHRLEHEAM